jgi:exonuclease VII small subunit
MGAIPLQLARSLATSTDGCRLCAEMSGPDAGLASALRHLPHIVPLAVAATAGLLLAALDGGPAGLVGAGVAAGMFACALYVWRGRRSLLRSAHEAHNKELHAVVEDADCRVELVIRQYEWAVEDFAKLRARLEQAEADVQVLTERARDREHQNEQLVGQISRLRERLAEIAMAASLTDAGKELPPPPLFEALYFTWGVHLDGARARLELQIAANGESPERVRVMDRDGQIVAVSGLPVVSLDGNLEFQLEPPLDLIADLDEGREIDYAIEALVEREWKPARLNDSGLRTTSVVDAQGRLSRIPDASDVSQLVASASGPRSALN